MGAILIEGARRTVGEQNLRHVIVTKCYLYNYYEKVLLIFLHVFLINNFYVPNMAYV